MKKQRSVGLLLIGIFVIGIILISLPKVYGGQNDTVEIILPTGSIKLYTPLEIEDAMTYLDGGTISVIIKDSNGKTFPLCLDGRLQAKGFGEFFKTSKPYHIYVKAVYPDSPKAKKIPIDGKEEKSILKMLQNLVAERLSGEEQTKLLNTNTHNLSEKDVKIYLVLKVIKTLENR